MKPPSLELQGSAWLNGRTQSFPTVCGSELGGHEGQVQLGTAAFCRGLEDAQDDFLVARSNFNSRKYKNAQSILNAL